MADQPSKPVLQGEERPEHKPRAGFELTREQIQRITDRVYTLLLRDLKHERERQRFTVTFKRG